MQFHFNIGQRNISVNLSDAKKKLTMLLVICALPAVLFASHFRYGSISWTNTTGNAVTFKISQAWRGNSFGAFPTVGSTVNITGSGTFDFGDGSAPAFLALTVTSVNPGENWFYGETTITHTYPSAGSYTAAFANCCRISTLINNADGNYRTGTTINVGSGNSSPVSTIVPIVDVPVNNATYNFTIPAADQNGSPLSFRLSTAAEAGGGFSQPPGLSINSSTGQMTFNTTGKVIGQLYSTQIMISDGTIEVPLDFIIRISGVVGTAPVFIAPTPANGSVLTFNVGQLSSFMVQASDADPSDIVTLTVAGAPVGSSFSPLLPATGNPVSSTFSWTPAAVGTFVLNFNAQDNTLQSANTSITINVVPGTVCNLDVTGEITNAACLGGSTGAIDITLTGGTSPFMYDWDDLAGSNDPEDRTGLPAGTYSVTVTDANSCTATYSGMVMEPATALFCSISVSPSITVAGHNANTIYLGYGPQTVTLTAAALGGTPGYTYNWGAAGMGMSVDVSPTTSTTYTLVVTDVNGCQTNCQVTINVVDVRCGKKMDKVLVCHKEPKKGQQPLCIGVDGVADHLAHGDYLGECENSSQGGSKEITATDNITMNETGESVSVFPNPTSNYFILRLENKASERIMVKVVDMYSKLVDVYTITNSNITMRLGAKYKPGIYYVTILKGQKVTTVKIIKN